MRITKAGVVLCFMMIVCGCNETYMNELPMYGEVEKTPAQIEADNEFIKTITKDQTRKEASQYAAFRGWEYCNKGDLSTAMKRFNQAWLLDPENPAVFWGFGVVLGKQFKFDEVSIDKLDQSIDMLEKAVMLSPPNGRLLSDLALSYTLKGRYEKDYLNKIRRIWQEFFDKANTLCRQAMEIEPEYGPLYYRWAACLHYEGRNKEALSMIEKAKKFKCEVPQDFIRDVKREIRK